MRALVRRLVPSFLLSARQRQRRRSDLRWSIQRLRELPVTCTPAQAYNFAQTWRGRGEFASIQPLQNKPEIVGLIDLLTEESVRTAAEIGSFLGGTLFIMTRTLSSNLRLVSLDWPEADPLLRTDRMRRLLHEAFATRDQSVTVVYGDSKADNTRVEFAKLVAPLSLDCLIIDGDHSAEGVRSDFQRYRQFVRPGGMLVFHDIVPHDGMAFGVAEFWAELKEVGRHVEIVERGGWERRSGGGIGVWWNDVPA